MAVAGWIVNLLAAYAALGVLFAFAFEIKGIRRVDPVTRDSTIAFRLMIVPGIVALWPLLAAKWMSAGRVRS